MQANLSRQQAGTDRDQPACRHAAEQAAGEGHHGAERACRRQQHQAGLRGRIALRRLQQNRQQVGRGEHRGTVDEADRRGDRERAVPEKRQMQQRMAGLQLVGTKAARPARPAPIRNQACGAVSSPISTRPFNRKRMAAPIHSRPSQSSGSAGARSFGMTGMYLRIRARAPRQNGTTTKKIARQPNSSTSSPPTVGTRAGAITTPKPKIPIARPCSSRGNIRITITLGIGMSMPAATP